jgi:hypothetical protein
MAHIRWAAAVTAAVLPVDRRWRRLVTGVAAALVLATGVALPAAAHEERELGEFTIVVGFIEEPVFVGARSGLEFFVSRGDEPVQGLEETLQAEVLAADQTRVLPISPRLGQAGAYESIFFPTAAGPYTFRIFGSIEGTAIDESFTSGPEGFSEVEDVTSAQFPIQFPAHAELVEAAERGEEAAGQVTVALVLGATGVLLGLAALGLVLAGRRRSA